MTWIAVGSLLIFVLFSNIGKANTTSELQAPPSSAETKIPVSAVSSLSSVSERFSTPESLNWPLNPDEKQKQELREIAVQTLQDISNQQKVPRALVIPLLLNEGLWDQMLIESFRDAVLTKNWQSLKQSIASCQNSRYYTCNNKAYSEPISRYYALHAHRDIVKTHVLSWLQNDSTAAFGLNILARFPEESRAFAHKEIQSLRKRILKKELPIRDSLEFNYQAQLGYVDKYDYFIDEFSKISRSKSKNKETKKSQPTSKNSAPQAKKELPDVERIPKEAKFLKSPDPEVRLKASKELEWLLRRSGNKISDDLANDIVNVLLPILERSYPAPFRINTPSMEGHRYIKKMFQHEKKQAESTLALEVLRSLFEHKRKWPDALTQRLLKRPHESLFLFFAIRVNPESQAVLQSILAGLGSSHLKIGQIPFPHHIQCQNMSLHPGNCLIINDLWDYALANREKIADDALRKLSEAKYQNAESQNALILGYSLFARPDKKQIIPNNANTKLDRHDNFQIQFLRRRAEYSQDCRSKTHFLNQLYEDQEENRDTRSLPNPLRGSHHWCTIHWISKLPEFIQLVDAAKQKKLTEFLSEIILELKTDEQRKVGYIDSSWKTSHFMGAD